MKVQPEAGPRFSTWFIQVQEEPLIHFVWTADPSKLEPASVVAKVMVERVGGEQILSFKSGEAEPVRTEFPLAVVQQQRPSDLKELTKAYLRGFNPDAIIEANFDFLPYAVILIKMARAVISGGQEPDQPSKIVHLTLER